MSAASQIVSELMHQPLISVGPGASVEEAMTLAKRHGIHHLPVVRGSKVLGIVCTCDLGGARPELRVLQLARRNVVAVEPDCSAVDAARLMVERVVGSLIVRNGDGVWGIVTRSDLMQTGEASTSVLSELHCSACRGTRHLRQGPGDSYLCVHCAERASASHWFDEGCGG